MAVGLNYYLKYYCNTNVSWFVDDHLDMPATLPAEDKKVTVDARCKDRFFLNYCTFGYTMPWWQWEDWEHFIDWMALNGINLPLAITGQESIWLKVWTKLGLSESEVRNYFTGPAHLPWHRMLNIPINTLVASLTQWTRCSQRFRKCFWKNRTLFTAPIISTASTCSMSWKHPAMSRLI